MQDDPNFHKAIYTRAEIEHAVRLIFVSKQRFRDVGFDLLGAAGPTPDARTITVIGVPLANRDATYLAPELVASVRRVLAVILRDAVIDPDDVKIESARSREEWFGDPSSETGRGGPQPT